MGAVVGGFWAEITAQIAQLERATSADDVIRVLTDGESFPVVFGEYGTSSGDAFFAGSGGDESVWEALRKAGWDVVWARAGYYWSMRSPDRKSAVTYVEGDVYRGVQKPI